MTNAEDSARFGTIFFTIEDGGIFFEVEDARVEITRDVSAMGRRTGSSLEVRVHIVIDLHAGAQGAGLAPRLFNLSIQPDDLVKKYKLEWRNPISGEAEPTRTRASSRSPGGAAATSSIARRSRGPRASGPPRPRLTRGSVVPISCCTARSPWSRTTTTSATSRSPSDLAALVVAHAVAATSHHAGGAARAHGSGDLAARNGAGYGGDVEAVLAARAMVRTPGALRGRKPGRPGASRAWSPRSTPRSRGSASTGRASRRCGGLHRACTASATSTSHC